MKQLEEKIVRMLVIDKHEGTTGLIFKKPQYLVMLQPLDEKDITKPSIQLEIPLHRYQKMEINNEIDVGIYSLNGKNWYFSKEEAELLTPWETLW